MNNELLNTYPFSEIEQHIIGGYYVSDCFSFVSHSDRAPVVGDKIQIEDNVYEVESVVDDTSDSEFGEGLSYSKVTLCLYVR